MLRRSLVITLPPLERSKRRKEKEMLAEFDRLRPCLLGALCTAALVVSLRNADSVRLGRRCAWPDFAADVVAAEPALPWEPGHFLEAYSENQRMSASSPSTWTGCPRRFST